MGFPPVSGSPIYRPRCGLNRYRQVCLSVSCGYSSGVRRPRRCCRFHRRKPCAEQRSAQPCRGLRQDVRRFFKQHLLLSALFLHKAVQAVFHSVFEGPSVISPFQQLIPVPSFLSFLYIKIKYCGLQAKAQAPLMRCCRRQIHQDC